MSSVLTNAETDTVCPVCWESVHSDKPVGVSTGCGHLWHGKCYRAWKRQGEYQYELSTTTASSGHPQQPLTLNSHLNCLICNQPTRNFVDLFIRLPSATPNHKDLVAKIEHEFHTVSRRTQLSLEKEIARREFEQTWLQEERQLSVAAQDRVRQRHDTAIRELESQLEELKQKYQRKMKVLGGRNRDSLESGTDIISNHDYNNGGGSSLDGSMEESIRHHRSEFLRWIHGTPIQSMDDDDRGEDSTSISNRTIDAGAMVALDYEVRPLLSGETLVEERTSAVAAASQELDLMDESIRPLLQPGSLDINPIAIQQNQEDMTVVESHVRSEDTATPDSAEVHPHTSTYLGATTLWQRNTTALSNNSNINIDSAIASRSTRRAGRNRMTQEDNIPYPDQAVVAPLQAMATLPAIAHTRSRGSRCLLKDDTFLPKTATTKIGGNDKEGGERKLPAKGTTHSKLLGSSNFGNTPPAASLSADYERQRLQAEAIYYQHQAELVEWELHQAEIELEQDELDLQQRERQITSIQRTVEDSFSSIQRRVEESKQEARDRQALVSLEEKFVTYKIARGKEEERYVQEKEHLQEDERHILEREKSEKRRQEAEKIRLRKELNELVKVMEKLERAKEFVKLAEEQSSASQSLETCVVCFEPLVHEDSELGVAVPCGHSFHSACFASWEKSKQKRGSSTTPCPLCNVATNLFVTIRFNRPGCSMYCPTISSLAKHFKKEECRWQRRRLTGLSMASS